MFPRSCETDPIYLDYNATTPIDPVVGEAMMPYITTHFGNPSSGHIYGQRTKEAIEKARKQVANLINCDPEEILFLSGGSESINMSLIGGSLLLRDQGHTIISSGFEHPATNETLDYLEKEYHFTIKKIPIDNQGFVQLDKLKEYLSPDVVMVSCMLANNELGSIQPIAEISSIVKEYAKEHNIKILVHTDASQAMGKIDVDVQKLNVDYLTLAAHKFYGPKGVGCSYINKNSPTPLVLIHGAKQESGRRAGTENVILDVGMGRAAELVKSDIQEKMVQYAKLRNLLRDLLVEQSPVYTRVNTLDDPSRYLPNTLSISFKGVPASCILYKVDGKVATSAGAACHSSADILTISEVLQAAHIPKLYALGTLRLSVGRYTTEEDIRNAVVAIMAAVNRLITKPTGPMRLVWEKLNITNELVLKKEEKDPYLEE